MARTFRKQEKRDKPRKIKNENETKSPFKKKKVFLEIDEELYDENNF